MAHELYMQGMSYNEPDHWADSANCKGMAYELFEYQEKDSPLAKGMSHAQRLNFNAANFELAAEICIECPVFFQCGRASTQEDRRWTVRAGEVPTRYAYEQKQGLSYEGSGKPRTCKRGHLLPEGGRCGECKRDAMRRRRQGATVAGQADRG